MVGVERDGRGEGGVREVCAMGEAQEDDCVGRKNGRGRSRDECMSEIEAGRGVIGGMPSGSTSRRM